MDTGPIIILANDQKCCYYQSSIQYIARIITTILHHNRDTTDRTSLKANNGIQVGGRIRGNTWYLHVGSLHHHLREEIYQISG